MPKKAVLLILAVLSSAGLVGCGGGDGNGPELVVYVGRNENLVRPLLDRFAKQTGIEIKVRYSDTAELLPTIIEEGKNTRADVFLSQDAGALGELADKRLLRALPTDLIEQVDPRFRDGAARWVGVTGRARVIAYNTEKVKPEDLPKSVLEVTSPKWKDKVGIAPTNASFVAFVSSLRETVGDERTRGFLEGLKANGAKRYDGNVVTLDAVASGEVELGLVNHYYLYNEFKERPKAPVANFYPGQDAGGEGTLINVSGVAVLANTDSPAEAERFVRFLLNESSQQFFRDETSEYPLRRGVDPIAELPPLSALKTIDLPLEKLGGDLEGTVKMIKDAGLS